MDGKFFVVEGCSGQSSETEYYYRYLPANQGCPRFNQAPGAELWGCDSSVGGILGWYLADPLSFKGGTPGV